MVEEMDRHFIGAPSSQPSPTRGKGGHPLLKPALLALSLIIGGIGPTLAEAASPPLAEAALTDLAGTVCRQDARTDISPDPGAPTPINLYCGTRTHPTGAVSAIALPLSLPADTTARRAAIEKTAASAAAGRDSAARLSCRAGSWITTDDGLDVLIRPCSLNDGQWPQVVVIAGLDKVLFQAEGLPAMMPVLEAVMAQQADYQAAAGKAAFGGRDKARDLIEKAFGEPMRLVSGGDFDRFNDLMATARLENSRKNYRAAEDSYRATMAIQERVFGADSPTIGKTLMDLALEVSNQGRFEEAAALFRRADPIIQRSPNAADQARYFTYMAYDAANAGRFSDAVGYARESTSIWRNLVTSDAPNLDDLGGDASSRSAMRGELAHSLTIEAAMGRRIGELSNAEIAAKEALGIIGDESGLPPWWRSEVLVTIGEIYAQQERYREAEESFRGALIYQQRLFGDSLPTATTLLLLGRVYATEGVAADSVRAFELAFRILEKDEYGRSTLVFDQIAPLLESATALANQRPDQQATMQALMFRGLQLVSGGVADQTISQATARMAAGNPQMERLVSRLEEADRARDAARIALAHETSLPDEQRGATKENTLLVEINTQNALREALLAQIQKDFPAYTQLAHPASPELAAVQKRLKANEALVLLPSGRERVFAVVVRPDRFVAKPVALDQGKLDASVRSLRKAFAVRRGGFDDFDLNDSHDLYRALFGPIESELDGVDHLVIVPSGALASLPPALLVTKRPQTAHDYRGAAWLVRRFATSQTPSVAAFVALRDRANSERAAKPFLGFANPAFTGPAIGASGPDARPSGLEALSGQCRDNGPIPPEFLRALAPLPDTATEVRAVSRALGAGPDALHLGADASETTLRQQSLADYRVLYFATHGLLPGELACQSEPALALSPPATPATTKDQDGLLDASEIAGFRLNADLVVLSACNTAQTTSQFGGEALSGLAEAFFYAGARTLVASHWQVPSAATTELMVGMFQRLGPNLAPGTAEALRQSQLALIDQPATAHPFFWAAFTVVGDGGRNSTIKAAEK